jgi:8-hydroxy-5-deazaflavin:NADPH oxidoreductase
MTSGMAGRHASVPVPQTPRLAVLGVGHVGPVVARLAIKAGYPVSIAHSGDPEDIALIAEVVVPGARPRWAADAVADADIVVLAMPLHRFNDVDPRLLDGKLVVDAMNYWPDTDGVLDAFERGRSSEVVARRLVGSTVVKSLNHIGYHELEYGARAAGAPDRLAVGVAGDDPGATGAVADLVDRLGYDPVRLGSLRAGQVLEPGGPVFGTVLGPPEFRLAVQAPVGSVKLREVQGQSHG